MASPDCRFLQASALFSTPALRAGYGIWSTRSPKAAQGRGGPTTVTPVSPGHGTHRREHHAQAQRRRPPSQKRLSVRAGAGSDAARAGQWEVLVGRWGAQRTSAPATPELRQSMKYSFLPFVSIWFLWVLHAETRAKASFRSLPAWQIYYQIKEGGSTSAVWPR